MVIFTSEWNLSGPWIEKGKEEDDFVRLFNEIIQGIYGSDSLCSSSGINIFVADGICWLWLCIYIYIFILWILWWFFCIPSLFYRHRNDSILFHLFWPLAKYNSYGEPLSWCDSRPERLGTMPKPQIMRNRIFAESSLVVVVVVT